MFAHITSSCQQYATHAVRCACLYTLQAGHYIDTQVLKPTQQKISSVASKVSQFIKNNWQKLILYGIAWATMLVAIGVMYGFSQITMPLIIGMGGGALFGVLIAILATHTFDAKGRYSIWNCVNSAISKLDPNGTRPMVITIMITFLLAASVLFPYVLGGTFGLLIGNQLASKVLTSQKLGSDPNQAQNLRQLQIEQLSEEIAALRTEIQQHASQCGYQQTLTQLEDQLHTLQHQLTGLRQTIPLPPAGADI